MANLSIGLVGLPNVGKSTLFNAITKAGVQAANYPFCTIEPNVGVVTVPDARVDRMIEIVKPRNEIYATIEFVDIAGLVKGASKGEGKGNQFLENIHHTDAILHVVRCFDDPNVVHVDGTLDPIADANTINLELILADLELVSKLRHTLGKKARGNDKDALKTLPLLEKMNAHLETEKPLRSLDLSNDEKALLKQWRFITTKSMIYAANVAEDDLPSMDNQYVQKLTKLAQEHNATIIPICGKIEEEICQLDDKDAPLFLKELGLKESGLNRLIKLCYKTLGLATYITAGEQEVRAWTITQGTVAPKAAAVIHTDFEKGFIRAEVTKFEDVDRLGSCQATKEAGLMRVEGKDYIVEDGDVIYFRVSTN